METVKEHINRIKEDNHTKVYYRFNEYGDTVQHIELFLHEFSSFRIGLNGEFIKPDGKVLHSCFIKRTG